MKYGVADYGMNVWFGGNYDLEDRLTKLKAIGFNGIERLEAGNAAEAIERAAIFRKLGMDFATVRINDAAQNIQYAAAFGKSYTWLIPGSPIRDTGMDVFVRRAKNFCEACKKLHIEPALHNHLGQVVENQDELDYFMKEVPDAFLLLDIGHLAGAGGDVVGTLEKYYDRISAVHFKDIYIKDENETVWNKRLRFCEVGGSNRPGLVDWQGAAEFLKKKNYDKWLHIEHDTHLNDPYVDLKVSIDRLKAILG